MLSLHVELVSIELDIAKKHWMITIGPSNLMSKKHALKRLNSKGGGE